MHTCIHTPTQPHCTLCSLLDDDVVVSMLAPRPMPVCLDEIEFVHVCAFAALPKLPLVCE